MTLLIQIPQSTAELGGDRLHGAVFPREGLHLHTSLKCPFQVTSRPRLLDGRRHGQVPDEGPLSDAPAHRVNPSGQGARPFSSFCTPSAATAREGGPRAPSPRAVAVPLQPHRDSPAAKAAPPEPPRRPCAAPEFPSAGGLGSEAGKRSVRTDGWRPGPGLARKAAMFREGAPSLSCEWDGVSSGLGFKQHVHARCPPGRANCREPCAEGGAGRGGARLGTAFLCTQACVCPRAARHGPSQRPLPSAALPRAGSQAATLLRPRSRLHHQDVPRSLHVYFCCQHAACGDFSATSLPLEPGRNAHGAPVKGPAAARAAVAGREGHCSTSLVIHEANKTRVGYTVRIPGRGRSTLTGEGVCERLPACGKGKTPRCQGAESLTCVSTGRGMENDARPIHTMEYTSAAEGRGS
ncbi:uncharacterized protein LOC132240527 isoform X2 [Myotis daubentonii]|uniref:uncharacterized protein LOC132240527 isoform X2 n=1 Tax=Myotis daubentonii TaxID=98922 RepID=UPI002873C8AD|nr:uncharacterized protein LOC132240527 isoform X2 [Myotis daubentonii]